MPETFVPTAKLYDVLYQHRFKELDGLRGIAAVAVGVNHALTSVLIVAPAGFGAYLILHAADLINGGTAVDLFFIMSGFFLTGMLQSQPAGTLFRYYGRRLTRLVPPAIAAVILLYIYAVTMLRAPPEAGGTALDYAQFYSDNRHMSLKDLALNILLIRHTLNPPLWTIRIEVATSLLFPLVFFAKNLFVSSFPRLALLLGLLLIAFLIGDRQKLGIDVLQYLYMFYAGALIRDYGGTVAKLPRALQYGLAILCAAGLLLASEFIPTGGWHPFAFDLPITLFGTGLITLIAFGTIPHVRRLFTAAPVQFLGRISYSFYLVSWLVIRGTGDLVIGFAIAQHLGIFATIMLITVMSTAACLAAGYLLHVAIEQPSVAFSRHIFAKPVTTLA